MFEQLLKYKSRLRKVREELADIDEGLSKFVQDDNANEDTKALALGVCRLCRILVRVIDSLPG